MGLMLTELQEPKSMEFEYFGGAQRSVDWYKLKLGKIGASRLSDWTAVSKAKTTLGKPLLARLNYEKELIFERQFGVSFEHFVTSAMAEGIEFEDFACKQYEKIQNVHVDECGAWYNEYLVASPDRTVGKNGLVEAKVLKDNSFNNVLFDGVPDKHWQQIQGQLMASKLEWCDYVPINLSTKKIKIIRVFPDLEFHAWLELLLQEEFVTEPMDMTNVYDFVDEIPQELETALEKDITEGW